MNLKSNYVAGGTNSLVIWPLYILAGLVLIALLPACAQSTVAEPQGEIGISADEAVPVGPKVAQAEPALRPTIEIAPPEGSWAGEFKFDDEREWVLLLADFVAGESGAIVEISFPLHETIPPAAAPVQLGGADDPTAIQFAIPFAWAGRSGPLSFAGHRQENKIVGQISHGPARGVFELTPLADFAPDVDQGRT